MRGESIGREEGAMAAATKKAAAGEVKKATPEEATKAAQAAKASGAKLFPRLRDIILPLARPGMIAGWILVFMPALRELTVSILLYAYHTETIGVVVYNLQDAGYREIAAALASIVMGLLIVGNMIIRKLTGGVAGF